MMKKIFALIVLASVLLFFSGTTAAENKEYGSYNLLPSYWNEGGAYYGNIIFKLNVKDRDTGEPIPGVYIKTFSYQVTNTNVRANNRVEFNTTASNIQDGIAYYSVTYLNANGGDGKWAGMGAGWSNLKIFTADFPYAYWDSQEFDFDPVSDTYAYDLTADYKIRNCINGASINKITKTVGTGGPHYDNFYCGRWFITHGASAEFDIFVYNKDHTKPIYIYFVTNEISNSGSFGTKTVAYNGLVSSLGLPTPICTDSSKEFDHWEYNGREFNPNTEALTHNITLRPVWKSGTPTPPPTPEPGATGKIKFKVYLWDHDAFMAVKDTDLKPKVSDYSWVVNGVKGNYSADQYLNNPGWVNSVPVSGLRFTLRTYDEDKSSTGAVPLPGTSEITTDSNGEATYTISETDLAQLKINYVIDCDPDNTCIATIYRGEDTGIEYCVFNWDIAVFGAVQHGGDVGVRYVQEGPRHDNTGTISLSNHNDNDAIRITSDNIKNGFEATFVCYVTPAFIARFDVNGGTMPAWDPETYPVQTFEPVNSAGKVVNPWVIQTPKTLGSEKTVEARPTPPAGKIFEGWHEVRWIFGPMQDIEWVDPNPWNFNTVIKRYTILKAIYVSEPYTVRWAPSDWTGNDSDLYEKGSIYQNGDYPTYNVSLPSKSYNTFLGWDLYLPSDDPDAKQFGDKNYKFEKTIWQPEQTGTGREYMMYVETTFSSFWASPKTIADADQLYIARFDPLTILTVTKSGMGAGESAIFTVSNGSETRRIFLTGNSQGTSASKTLLVTPGTWTVTEESKWSWAYDSNTTSQTLSIADGDQKTVTFNNTAKAQTPKHGESHRNNSLGK